MSDRPVRYHVVTEYNEHGGAGWAVFDRELQRVSGGWFVDRIAAERTAEMLNQADCERQSDGSFRVFRTGKTAGHQ